MYQVMLQNNRGRRKEQQFPIKFIQSLPQQIILSSSPHCTSEIFLKKKCITLSYVSRVH
uniref:Uncharacterized protein n=1 Tax=Rhizophora mucronata TaxID=61149 RepID=A0A2P2JUC7_RHIMU